MASDGHAPTDTRTSAYRLSKLGEGVCPDCSTSLRPAGNSSYACPTCEAVYPVAGGAP